MAGKSGKYLGLFVAASLALAIPAAQAAPLQAFGDSITVGVGASSKSASWAGLCTPAPADYGVSGDQAADMAAVIESAVPDPKNEYALMIGTNDHRTYRGDPAKQGFFKAFLLESLVWLLADQKIKGQDAGMHYTGAWDNAGVNGFGKDTAAKGATASARVIGTAVYIGYLIQDAPDTAGAADVFIDGVKAGALDSAGEIDTVNHRTNAPAARRFGGLKPGAHTVKLAVTSADGRKFYLNYIAGSRHAAAPKILLSNVIRMSGAAYAQFASSDAIVDQYNKIIDGLIADMNTDGFAVKLIDNHGSLVPPADFIADGAHPNDSGHRKIHDNFAARSVSCR